MIRVALCDDNSAELQTIVDQFTVFKQTIAHTNVEFEAFGSAIEILDAVHGGKKYDLAILDVVMPAMNGIALANELRFRQACTNFIFLTSSAEYAIDAYSVEAIDYILKPITPERLSTAFQRFLKRFKDNYTDEIVIADKSNITRIPLHTLVYIEVFDHYLFFHLANGQVIRQRQKISEVESILSSNPYFIRSHRAYIVNIRYITRIEPGNILMQNSILLPVSKANHRALSDVFLKYRFEN